MDIIGKICMVRTYSAGVFLGEVVSRTGKEVYLKNARRIPRQGALSHSIVCGFPHFEHPCLVHGQLIKYDS